MPKYARFGWTRAQLGLYVPFPAGTGLAEPLTDFPVISEFLLVAARLAVAIAGAGAGATRTLRVLKGASTVVATGTVTLAGTATVGAVVSLTVTDDGETNRFRNGDVLTVDFASGGTAFTGGAGNVLLTTVSQPQTL